MPSLVTYRRALGRVLNDLRFYTATAGASGTVTIPDTIDITTGASAERYNGAYLYVATGAASPQQRRVKGSGFAPLTGVFTTETSWSAPASGNEIEITRLFPVIESVPGEDASYQTIVNRALARLLVPDRITTSITTADTYSTTTWAWLDRSERLVQVLEPAPISGRAARDASWRGPRLVLDGPAPFLQLATPFEAATGTLTLSVLRPGHTLNGTTEVLTGLASDAETALPSVEDFLPSGLLEAYSLLRMRGLGRPGNPWDKRWATQLGIARRGRYWDRSTETAEERAVPAEAAA